ncbi:MAG: hypothetical protein KDJ18_14260 [Hyphomicrobiaceae bacterium]|nr:hypothetical protein [Hyphomicrobiaceae bacterium]
MATSEDIQGELLKALDAAFKSDWETVHGIVQKHETSPIACWLHAVLHKVEGDHSNARYWYARTHMNFERFPDPKVELRAILHELIHDV